MYREFRLILDWLRHSPDNSLLCCGAGKCLRATPRANACTVTRKRKLVYADWVRNSYAHFRSKQLQVDRFIHSFSANVSVGCNNTIRAIHAFLLETTFIRMKWILFRWNGRLSLLFEILLAPTDKVFGTNCIRFVACRSNSSDHILLWTIWMCTSCSAMAWELFQPANVIWILKQSKFDWCGLCNA